MGRHLERYRCIIRLCRISEVINCFGATSITDIFHVAWLVLQTIHELLRSGRQATLRDLYYMLVNSFNQQVRLSHLLPSNGFSDGT